MKQEYNMREVQYKEVTAAIIVENGRVLIAKRSDGGKMDGRWEFPGGKIEPGETPEQCLKREIQEELAVEIEVLEFFGESIHRAGHGAIRLMAYLCRREPGELVLSVHSEVKWAGSSELLNDDLAPADLPLAYKLHPLLV